MIAIVSQFDQVESIDVVLLGEPALIEKGLQVKQTPGVTVLRELEDKHHDIVQLTYKTLGVLATAIVEKIRADEVLRYTKSQIIALLRNAVHAHRIEADDLRAGVKSKVCC